MSVRRIGFIGFGEAASAIVSGWGAARVAPIATYDIKLDCQETAGEIEDRAAEHDVAVCRGPKAAVSGADLVFSTVTADQAVVAAEAAAPHLAAGTYWLDLNSCAPSSKRIAAKIVEAAAGRYVDVAVLAPVYPIRNMVPCLIAGPHAEAAARILSALPMSLRVVPGEVGAASSIKMIRSVLIKGVEAVTAECVLAAEAAGVVDEVLPSLEHNFPGFDWDAQAAYNFERAMVHGLRRAAEMEEVAKTLDDLGLPADMSRATVLWERRIAEAGVAAPKDPRGVGAGRLAASLLPKLRR